MNKTLEILVIIQFALFAAAAVFAAGYWFGKRKKVPAQINYSKETKRSPMGIGAVPPELKDEIIHAMEAHIIPDLVKDGAPEQLIEEVKAAVAELKRGKNVR